MRCPFINVGNKFINFNNVDSFVVHYKEVVYKKDSDHPIYPSTTRPYVIEITNINNNTSYYQLNCEEYKVFYREINYWRVMQWMSLLMMILRKI